jgi:signal transduction histidine kinase/ActR/RegA family two-component response regulator
MLRIIASLLITLLLCSHATANTALPSPVIQDQNTIILAPGPIYIHLNQSIQWLKAGYKDLSLGQLQAQPNAPFSLLNEGAVLESNQVYWLKMRVLNSLNKNMQLALSLAAKNIIVEAAYLKSNAEWSYLTQVKPYSILSAHTSMMLAFEGHSDSWIYLRIKAPSTTKLDAKLQDMDHYTDDLIFYQQLIGASVAAATLVILLHLLIIQFHNHGRHYLVILMSTVSAIYISSHSPSAFLPSWTMSFSAISPWIIACTLALSSLAPKFYSKNMYSNQKIFIILSLIISVLILIKVSYATLLFISLIPAVFSGYRSLRESKSMFTACLLFCICYGWQWLYIVIPNSIWPPINMLEVYGAVLTTSFASISIITPYFKRQISRQIPNNENNYTAFLSRLSHSFRTPMNGVLGMSELLKDTPLTQQQQNYLSTIEQSGYDLLRLINRISDIGNIKTGKLHRDIQAFDLTSAIEKIIEKHIPLAVQNHVEVIVNIHPMIPKNIKCDEDRLHTVIDNLLLQALSSTNNGEIEIKAHWTSDISQDQILFTIRDSGQGISKDTLKQILNNQNPSNNSVMDIQNIDFGLLISKHIVEALHGKFYIESNANIGTSIRFSMHATPCQKSPAASLSNALNGLSILVVDDNSTFRAVIQQYAQSWGAHADTTYNGKEALALLRNHNTTGNPYDIILIDQYMPIMNGFQLASKIQDDPDINQNIIVVMLTGSGITSQNNFVVDAGIHQVIAKPVTSRALQATLIKHINQQKDEKSKLD